MKRLRNGQTRCILKRRCAAIRGKRSWAMTFDKSGHSLRDLVERSRRGDRLKRAIDLFQACIQPRVVMVLIAKVAAFDARVALVHWVIKHTANSDHPIRSNIDIDINRAPGMAEAAKRPTCFNCAV